MRGVTKAIAAVSRPYIYAEAEKFPFKAAKKNCLSSFTFLESLGMKVNHYQFASSCRQTVQTIDKRRSTGQPSINSMLVAGDLERLRRFWLTGTCNPRKEEKEASKPLAPEQFLSAFVLLVCGILLAGGLTGLEHAYVKWFRHRVAKTDKAGCCALISKVGILILFCPTSIHYFIRKEYGQDPHLQGYC